MVNNFRTLFPLRATLIVCYAILVLWVHFVVVGVLTQTAVTRFTKAQRTTASTVGIVSSFTPQMHNSGTVSYTVNNQDYKCLIYGLGDDNLSIGAHYVIFYNPDNPNETSDGIPNININKDLADIRILECIVLAIMGMFVFGRYLILSRSIDQSKPT